MSRQHQRACCSESVMCNIPTRRAATITRDSERRLSGDDGVDVATLDTFGLETYPQLEDVQTEQTTRDAIVPETILRLEAHLRR
jgi:hypothetical protein